MRPGYDTYDKKNLSGVQSCRQANLWQAGRAQVCVSAHVTLYLPCSLWAVRGEVSALLRLRNKWPLSKTRWPSAHYFRCCHNPTVRRGMQKWNEIKDLLHSHYYIHISTNALTVQPWTCQKQPGYTFALQLNSERPKLNIAESELALGVWKQEAGELQNWSASALLYNEMAQ